LTAVIALAAFAGSLLRAGPALAQEPILTPSTVIDGQGEDRPLGYVVAGAGDVNRDGYGDVLVGLPFFSGNEHSQEGRVLLFLGGPGGLSGTPAWRHDGGAYNAHFGLGIAGAGDVNGDGFDDVVIGAPDYPNDTDPLNDDGRAYVFLGTEGGLQGSPVWSADSGDFRTDFGFSVASAGDVNGDGYDDIIVGDYLCCFEAGRRGWAYVFHGSAGGPSATANWSVEGDTDFLFYGYGVAAAGDVNRDGFDDVIVSGYGTTGAGNFYNGRVSLYLGSPSGLGPAVWTVAGTQAEESRGRSIAGGGDIYGDGYPDLLVSSANGFRGVVSIYNGTAQGMGTSPSWSVTGPDQQGDYGIPLAGPGDVSGDGYDDIVFGTVYRDQAFLFTGSPSGPLLAPAQALTGPLNSRFGAALAGTGDVDGDGGLDVLVGAQQYLVAGTTVGRIELFRGRPPTVQLIDPACRTETECDGDYLKEANGEFVLDADAQNFSRLIEAPVRRRGTTADGVSRLLLRMPSNEPVTFSLKLLDGSSAGSEWGLLMKRDGSEPGDEVTVTDEQGDDGGRGHVFALYQPPIDFPGTAEEVGAELELILETTTSAGTSEQAIKLVAPPVVLVHGVWSDSDIWRKPGGGLLKHLRDRGFNVCDGCLVDYRDFPAVSFDPDPKKVEDLVGYSRLRTATNRARREVRSRGLANAQVDIVGHSEGGLLARARVATRAFAYRWKGNYGAGDFHKLITIGSPHRGTPFADFFLLNKCRSPWIGDYSNLEKTMEGINRPLGDAIFGFQTESPILERLGATAVPSHPIIGLEPLSGPTLGAEWILDWVISSIGSTRTVDTILDPGGMDGTHDTIVPAESQRGGSVVNTVPIDGVVHAGFSLLDESEAGSSRVWESVSRLLLRPVDQVVPEFAPLPVFVRPGITLPITEEEAACPAESAVADAGPDAATVTLSPAPGTMVRPGDPVIVDFSVVGGDAVDGALINAGGGLHVVPGPGPFEITFAAPADRAGRVDIRADTYGPDHENYSADTYIVVEPAEPPGSLEVQPDVLEFTLLGETERLRVVGRQADGTLLEVSGSSAGTLYAMQDGTGVAAVDGEGVVTALAPGGDVVVVTHGPLTARVPVTVRISNRAPVLSVPAGASMDAGAVLQIPITATDPDGHAMVLAVSGLPPFATFVDAGDGTGTIGLAPALDQAGTWEIYVTATDAGTPPLGAGAAVRVTVLPCTGPTPGVTPDLSLAGNDLLWTAVAGARAYDVVAGLMSTLRSAGGDFSQSVAICLSNDRVETTLTFLGRPLAGEAAWFLVRDVHCTGNGTYDSFGAGQAAPRDASIEASGRACP
jgi:hypothetical protein